MKGNPETETNPFFLFFFPPKTSRRVEEPMATQVFDASGKQLFGLDAELHLKVPHFAILFVCLIVQIFFLPVPLLSFRLWQNTTRMMNQL
jgi:hypothetical protein